MQRHILMGLVVGLLGMFILLPFAGFMASLVAGVILFIIISQYALAWIHGTPFRRNTIQSTESTPDPMPPGWNKTIADLMAEAKRGERPSVGGDEVRWAREYERSLLPQGTRYPCKGDVYECTVDLSADFLISFQGPVTGGGTGRLLPGDRIRIHHDPSDPQPIGVYAEAVDSLALEARLISEKDRSTPGYGGFYFFLKTTDLNSRFKLVENLQDEAT